MDTDELSSESYEGILIEAEKFNHDLTLQFGLLSYSCKNETEYLKAATKLIHKIKKMGKSDYPIFFFDIIPSKNDLHLCLDRILANISDVEKIPEKNRQYDF